MLAAAAQDRPGTGTYRHVYRDEKEEELYFAKWPQARTSSKKYYSSCQYNIHTTTRRDVDTTCHLPPGSSRSDIGLTLALIVSVFLRVNYSVVLTLGMCEYVSRIN